MKKFTSIIFVFILVISILIILIQANPNISTAVILQKAFSATGAKIAASEIYIRAELDAEGFENMEKRQQLLSDIIAGAGGDIAGLKPVYTSVDNDISFGNETDYLISDNSNIHIRLLKNRQEGESEKYQAIISLTDTSQEQEMAASVTGLTDVLKKVDINPEINLCITGSLNGNLKENELEVICKKTLDSIGANRVEGIRDKGLISVSAFSPSIDEAVRVNGKQVNLNMAVRYNSYEGKTYIWLATPVITTEY